MTQGEAVGDPADLFLDEYLLQHRATGPPTDVGMLVA